MNPYLLPTPPARPSRSAQRCNDPQVRDSISSTRDPGHVRNRTAGVIACSLRRVVASAAPGLHARLLGTLVVIMAGAEDVAEVRNHQRHVVGGRPPFRLGPQIFLLRRAFPLAQL